MAEVQWEVIAAVWLLRGIVSLLLGTMFKFLEDVGDGRIGEQGGRPRPSCGAQEVSAVDGTSHSVLQKASPG